MGVEFDIRGDVRELARGLNDFARRQLPFATAQMLTATARQVAAEEQGLLRQTFDTPTPFTLNAFRVRPARKSNLTATVFAGDIQAAYLEPYLDGGKQVLGKKRAILTPIKVGLNAYGNIPRGKLASLKGRPGVFVGAVKTKGGQVINGVWQRQGARKVGRRGRRGAAPMVQPGRLKLLIEFTDPKTVTKRLPYFDRAEAVINRVAPGEFATALKAAMATAR